MDRIRCGGWAGLALIAIFALCLPCSGRVVYVDGRATGAHDGSSWQNACQYLQDALAMAASVEKPVEIRIAWGVYKPDQGAGITPGDQAATFNLLNGVTLKGGYAGTAAPDPNARDISLYQTILSGDLAGNDLPNRPINDNSLHVVTASGTDGTAVIEGFTVTAGHPPGPGLYMPSSSSTDGGSMLIDGASPTVLHCCFTNNYASASNGALLARNASNPVVANCTFLNNEGTGMSNLNNSNPIVTDCRFESNTGRGMENRHSSPIIKDCLFIRSRGYGSSGYGIYAQDCNSVLTDCLFDGRDSSISERGIQCDGGRLTLRGCTFTGLTRGAIHASEDLDLTRCVFMSNGPSGRGAVECDGALVARACAFVGNTAGRTQDIHGFEAGAIFGLDVELHDCEFAGNWGLGAGAVRAAGTLVATGCVFSGNSTGQLGVGAIQSSAQVLLLSNCTFIANRGRVSTIDWSNDSTSIGELTQCIIRDGPNPFSLNSRYGRELGVTYSDVQGGYPGQGNIDVDPCFVDPGHWADANDLTKEVGPDDPGAVWVAGDYHLKSQGGHWDRTAETWVRDDVTSACIDAGDPNSPLGLEPFPNGGVVNIGAYGGTAEAGKSYFGEPICETQMAGDINGDCNVDQADMDLLMAHWLMEDIGVAPAAPTIAITSPENGAELTYPTPIILKSDTTDPGGAVLWVMYTIEHYEGAGRIIVTALVSDPADKWAKSLAWSSIGYDGTYTVWAELLDSRGIKVTSPRIRVTLHRSK